MVHKTAQPVDFERSKQPPFLRRVEQCEGFFRLLKRDSLNIFTGVHAVPSGCLKAGMPGVAGGEQESHPQADSYDIWFPLRHCYSQIVLHQTNLLYFHLVCEQIA